MKITIVVKLKINVGQLSDSNCLLLLCLANMLNIEVLLVTQYVSVLTI